MERRELLALFGTGAAGLLLSGTARAADEGEGKELNHEHIKKMGECAIVCNMTTHHCLEQLKKGGEHRDVHANALQMTNDCQTFCVQAVTLMTRHSPLAKYAHQACADACRDCAAACEKGEDEMMKKCAEVCKACEEACRACCAKPA
jgi:hypothetical protein